MMTRLERLNRHNRAVKQRRDAARAAGICTTCVKRPAEPGLCRCSECNLARLGPLMNMTGKVIGRLTVLRRAFAHDNKTRWMCQCECGDVVNVRGDHLRSGDTKSCGCLRSETTTAKNEQQRLGEGVAA